MVLCVPLLIDLLRRSFRHWRDARNMILPADVVDSAVHFTYSLQTGSYPETGFEEIGVTESLFLEADFLPGIVF